MAEYMEDAEIRKPVETLARFEFHKAIWLLPCVWALHEAEEWNILEWYERYWVNVPPMKQTIVWIGLVLMSLIGFAWTLLGTRLGKSRGAAFAVLPFFTVIAFGNALQHIWFVFKFGAYAPGVVTAVVLIIPSTLFITSLALQRRLIPRWYAIAIYLPIIPQLALAVQTGNKLPAIIETIYGFSSLLARLLFGAVS
jgi:hypothetical protein